jgi:hypothetical protein
MVRLIAAALVFSSSLAFAQSEDFSSPPLVPVDQPVQQVPVQPAPTLREQDHAAVAPLPGDGAQQPSPYQQAPQQPQYQDPQYQQQPQYQQDPRYQQQPPYQQDPRYQQDPQYQDPRYPQQRSYVPRQRREPNTGVHFGAMLIGSAGLFDGAQGYTAGVRGELDIDRIAINLTYNRFYSPTFLAGDVNEFTAMAGYSVLSGHAGRLRLLGGLDIVGTPDALGFAPVVGINTRLGSGLFGVEGSVTLTPFPFRALDLHAAVVLRVSIFEVAGGWRYQVIDTALDGSFFTSFLAAPAVNGPWLGVGISI